MYYDLTEEQAHAIHCVALEACNSVKIYGSLTKKALDSTAPHAPKTIERWLSVASAAVRSLQAFDRTHKIPRTGIENWMRPIIATDIAQHYGVYLPPLRVFLQHGGSIGIVGRRWFNSGNTYHSCTVQYAGQWLRKDFEYGYGDSYLYDTATKLLGCNSETLIRLKLEYPHQFHVSCSDVGRKKDL